MKTAIVTGASVGLGLSLAKKFIDHQYLVFGISRTKRHWETAKKEISDLNFYLIRADLTQESIVRKTLKKIYKQARVIDLLINNAGYGGRLERVEEISQREFKTILTQNLLSTFLMCKYTIPIFKAQKKGMIINISSMAGKRAVPQLAAYSASKFGVLALSQCIAKENAGVIKCITVCPGGMNTEMRASLFGREDANKQQSTEFVAESIWQIVNQKINIESGGDIVIRHGAIAAINSAPAA